MAKFPYYYLVPKEYKANLRWRKQILAEAAADPSFAAAIKRMCAEDALFYISGFAFTYDPRDTRCPNKPFITYEFQDKVIAETIDAIDHGYDMAWPKSRTMGASWLGLTVFEWYWHFSEMPLSFLLVSRNEDYVDKAGNPKSLFWKIDYLHANQPRWLLPSGRWLGWKDPSRKLLHLGNADNGSVIDGESTTGDVSRGDRRTAIFIDEHAAFELNDSFKVLKSTRDATKCRIFNSTPQGANNAFYEIVHNSSAKVIRMHWSQHPDYSRGLYTSERVNGVWTLKLLDTEFFGVARTMRKNWDEPKNFIFPEEYPFILDGKLRSPWYDTECARCVSEQEIAQELDIDFLGSAYQYFDPQFIAVLIQEYCTTPALTGRLRFDSKTLEPEGFEIDERGPLQLWFTLSGDGEVLKDRAFFEGRKFGLGSDVSMGTGASNSATSIVDRSTGRKVAVWKDPHVDAADFADVTIALAKWFNNGQMIWDGTGAAGRSFTKRVIEQRYSYIYYRRSEGRVRERISDQPGYYLNPEDRAVLLRDYRAHLQGRTFINPSEPGMRECLQFVVQPGGKVEHSAAANSQDPTGAREAHGDEAIADALASRLVTEKADGAGASTPEAPWMSPAWRLQEAERERLEKVREDW